MRRAETDAAERALIPSRRLPACAWHFACAARELPPGATLARTVHGRELALFRGRGGRAAALSAHCSHLGAHLANGVVVGDCLRCPLHHWEYDGAGICRRVPGEFAAPESALQRSYPVLERHGAVLVSPNGQPTLPAPAFQTPEELLLAAAGRPVALRCPWFAVIANAFDLRHLSTVHDRVLVETPTVEIPEPGRFVMRYVSAVTGRGLVDRTMRALSGNRIDVTITAWGGACLTVESRLGDRVRSALLIGFRPAPEGTEVCPVFSVGRSQIPGVDRAGLALARWLYSGFLSRDVAIMDGMLFRPRLLSPGDDALREFLRFLAALPRDEEPEERRP